MSKLKKLPEAEFEVMKVIWEQKPPVTTNTIMEEIGEEKGWKVPALTTLLNRLMERGFLRSEKHGKFRFYYPLIEQEDYLKFETESFMSRFHNNSISSLVASMSDDQDLDDDDLQKLLDWAKERIK